MIRLAQFRGFKSLADVRIDFEPLTVIVGPNGAGKTSILQGLHNLSRLVSASGRPGRAAAVDAVFAGAQAPWRVATRAPEPALFLAAEGDFGRLQVDGQPDAKEPNSAPWRYGLLRADLEGQVFKLGGKSKGDDREFFRPLFAAGLSRTVFLALNARVAARPHYSDSPEPRVEYDGDGLAVVLQKLQGLRDGKLEAIEQALATIVPGVQRIRALPASVRRTEEHRIDIDGQSILTTQERERTGAKVELEMRGAGWLPLDLLSEGTVLALTLLTVLHDQAPRHVLLDDIDRVLHPRAQQELLTQIRAFMAQAPGVQIIGTTHSPYLIDHFAVEEVRVMRLDEHGHSRCRRLDEHPRWAERKGYMEPGEFWAGVGEDWV